MKNTFVITAAFLITTLVSCTTDFPKKEVETKNLSGFITGGNAGGLYGDAGLKITTDSIQMTNWPVSRLTNNLKLVLNDSTLTDNTNLTDVYTIQIANKGELEQRDFIDSLVVLFKKNKLIK